MATSRRRINIELLLGISATFLSLAALIVSIFQTRIAREQQQASVWPYLQFGQSHLDNEFTFDLSNDGVGPSIIRHTEIHYQGKSFSTLDVLFRQELDNKLIRSMRDSVKNFKYGYFYQTVKVGNALKSGDKINLLSTLRNEQVAALMESVVSDTSFHLIVRYTDVYGNCWQLDRDKTTSLGKRPDE